jgi:hypothetical protein
MRRAIERKNTSLSATFLSARSSNGELVNGQTAGNLGLGRGVAGTMNPLDLVGLAALMERTGGKPEVGVGLVDGPIAMNHPDLTGDSIREVPGKMSGAWRDMFPRRRVTRFRPTRATDRLRAFEIGGTASPSARPSTA